MPALRENRMEAERTLDRWISAWCALAQRTRRWQATLDDRLRMRELNTTELTVLWRIGRALSPGIPQVELARELSISPAQVCGVVESLQTRQFVALARASQDRRRLFCSLTPQGRQLLAALEEELSPAAEAMLSEELLQPKPKPFTTSREEAA